MFTHLGENIVIPTKQIITILDVQALEQPSTKEFLQVARDEGFVIEMTAKPMSVIVTVDRVYLSPISSSTLRRRAFEWRNPDAEG